MTAKVITISGRDGDFSGYLAQPGSGRGPGIVVIQEIFGVNRVMRDIADGLASRGFFALVPDLFWRIQPGIELTDQSEAEWKEAFGLFQKFDVDKGVEDVQAAISFLRGHKGVNGKVGTLGYCLGGRLAYLAAARTDTDASVGYYGIGIESLLDEAFRIKKPLLLHVAEGDDVLGSGEIDSMRIESAAVGAYGVAGIAAAVRHRGARADDVDAARRKALRKGEPDSAICARDEGELSANVE